MTLVSCPTCHHKFTIPEGAMAKRHTCPNCQSLFVAGKSVAESDGRKHAPSMLTAAGGGRPAAGAGIDKTMLGEVDAPLIKYNCPRCKKPLEAPASEAGTKKPCPSCGGRLQVPAAPPRPAAAAAFDPMQKTMLAADESGLQATAPSPAMPVPRCRPPSRRQRPFRPRPSGQKWKIYAIGGCCRVARRALLLGKNGRRRAEKFLAAKGGARQLKLGFSRRTY